MSRGPSVVIPNWNGCTWLPDCLRALARQELVPGEVIVVDNGSSDGSLEYLRAEHPDIQVIALGTNTGFAYAANRGLETARGSSSPSSIPTLCSKLTGCAGWPRR